MYHHFPVLEHLPAAFDVLTAEESFFALTEDEVNGVPMRRFAKAPDSMRVIWELAGFHADREYIVYEDERYTYAEIDARVRTLAHRLRDVYGVGSGDRVAVAMRNYPEWVVSYWATVSLGAALVGMNAWWTGPEMVFGINDATPKVIIVDDEQIGRAHV